MAKGEDLKGRNVKMYNREHLTEEDILHTVNSDLTRLKEHIRILNLPN